MNGRVNFPEQRWRSAEGGIQHGWLFRRSMIKGISEEGIPRSEQVLKVGWPFTMARGFVWEEGKQVRSSGAVALEPLTGGAYRFWPTQPVWPGLVINSGIMLLFILIISRFYRNKIARI